ncbi:MAG: hypothetical protein QXV17_10015 [Candidatus Micrarchaeaceae archaeon]
MEAQIRTEVEAVFSSLKLGEYVSSALDAGIFNEIIAKVFTYNAVEAHRGGTRVSWTKGHLINLFIGRE